MQKKGRDIENRAYKIEIMPIKRALAVFIHQGWV